MVQRDRGAGLRPVGRYDSLLSEPRRRRRDAYAYVMPTKKWTVSSLATFG